MRTKEQWKPMKQTADLEVSNFGRVRSLIGRQRKRRDVPLVRKLGVHPSGHVFVTVRLSAGDRRTTALKVHHLVLEAFVGPRPAGAITRHLNGDPADNRASNLAWGTPRENYDDAVRMGEVARGQRHGMAKLSDADATLVRNSKELGRVLAKRFGVCEATVSLIRNGKIRKEGRLSA